MKLDRVILVFDDDVSSYRGMLRFADRLQAEVLHFSNRNDLTHWMAEHRAGILHRRIAFCVVFDPKFLDMFDALSVDDFPIKYPRICISRPGLAVKVLSAINTGLFDFIEKPFRLDFMRTALESAFSVYERDALINTTFKSLTRRELQTCEMVVSGLTSKEISEKLDISIKTVKAHRANLMRKVHVKSVTELLRSYDAFRSSFNQLHIAEKNISIF